MALGRLETGGTSSCRRRGFVGGDWVGNNDWGLLIRSRRVPRLRRKQEAEYRYTSTGGESAEFSCRPTTWKDITYRPNDDRAAAEDQGQGDGSQETGLLRRKEPPLHSTCDQR